MIKSLYSISNLKKTIFIYHKNYIILIYNKNIKYHHIYKIKNIENSYIYKLYMFSKADIFINSSNEFLKFKSEHEKFININFDCYHNNLTRYKIKTTINKMLIIILNILL